MSVLSEINRRHVEIQNRLWPARRQMLFRREPPPTVKPPTITQSAVETLREAFLRSIEQRGHKITAEIEKACQPEPTRRLMVADIIKEVRIHFDVPDTEMVSARRSGSVVYARQIAMYLARSLTLKSLPEIGRYFGKRDHTTVLHACRKITGLLDDGDEWTVAHIAELKGNLAERFPLPPREVPFR